MTLMQTRRTFLSVCRAGTAWANGAKLSAPRRPGQCRKRLDSFGLKAISTGTGWEQFDEDTKRIVGNAQALGATYIMCPGIPHKDVLTMADCQLAITNF